jgi:hypothetical protein
MKNNKAFTLKMVVKTCFFFYCNWMFLLIEHKYTKSINDFFIGRFEKDVIPPVSLGGELYNMIL